MYIINFFGYPSEFSHLYWVGACSVLTVISRVSSPPVLHCSVPHAKRQFFGKNLMLFASDLVDFFPHYVHIFASKKVEIKCIHIADLNDNILINAKLSKTKSASDFVHKFIAPRYVYLFTHYYLIDKIIERCTIHLCMLMLFILRCFPIM